MVDNRNQSENRDRHSHRRAYGVKKRIKTGEIVNAQRRKNDKPVNPVVVLAHESEK